ncbi:uncharacterized protein LOC119290662 [Triticum dicoccoides]|uniref:uncharacterized protein LOC119290662 n=1 Tax=Triticum dicoccoides TaxID=85692 RepID=UPI00188E6760|nr:uncharacterized protein LOC119290662 [Triticum dicoccoides]XP_037425192.1 uncharacterized protein LOC119290662 [Triticum dicoccoides]
MLKHIRVRNRLRREVQVPLRKVLELPEVYMSAHTLDELPYARSWRSRPCASTRKRPGCASFLWSMDIVIMVTLPQCIIFGSHIPQGAPSSDSMSADLRNNRRNNPAEEFGEEEQEKNTFILIGMETPVHIECIIANQLLCMVSGHACLFL